MKNEKGNFNRFNKMILIVLLTFLILPFSGLVNVQAVEESSDHSEMERYIDSASRITQIVSNSIITLPELDMLGADVITNLVTKVNKYSAFVNDYTQDIEGEGEALFNDLIIGYRTTRKLFYLAKSINNLASSQQAAYELVNTTDSFLSEQGGGLSNYSEFETSLAEYLDLLEENSHIVELLILNVLSDVNIDINFYTNDLNNLVSLRAQLKIITDSHLELSNDIINTSESVVDAVSSSESSDHGI